MRVLVASRNKKKLVELNRLLGAAGIAGIELASLRDIPEYPETAETGADFVDNARLKAADGMAHSGLVTIADDSGIAVDELRGLPGVLSARWAGRHGDDAANNQLLLNQLADTPDHRRAAQYVCVCVMHVPHSVATAAQMDTEYVGTGQWHGRIARAEQGTGGFGYDPLFLPDETPGLSAAQLSPEHKDQLSHRAQALMQLLPALRALSKL